MIKSLIWNFSMEGGGGEEFEQTMLQKLKCWVWEWGYCSLELIDVLELALHYCMTTKYLFDKLPNFPQNLRSSGPVRGI